MQCKLFNRSNNSEINSNHKSKPETFTLPTVTNATITYLHVPQSLTSSRYIEETVDFNFSLVLSLSRLLTKTAKFLSIILFLSRVFCKVTTAIISPKNLQPLRTNNNALDSLIYIISSSAIHETSFAHAGHLKNANNSSRPNYIYIYTQSTLLNPHGTYTYRGGGSASAQTRHPSANRDKYLIVPKSWQIWLVLMGSAWWPARNG